MILVLDWGEICCCNQKVKNIPSAAVKCADACSTTEMAYA